MTASKKRRTWKRAGTVFGVVLTFLLSVAVIAYWQTGIPGPAAQLEKNRKLAKANGLALTKSDYERMFAVPDSQNAVAFFPAEKPPELKPVSSASPEELDATWKLIEPKVRKMEAALEKPHFRLFQGREAMNSTDFGESSRPVAWVREFMRVADRDISLGNLPRAKRILILGASLCIKMMDDPSCLAGQYSLSCESILSNSLKRILFAHPTDQAWLKLAWDVATRLDVERPMRPAVISECRIRVLSWEILTRDPPTIAELARIEGMPLPMKIALKLPSYDRARLSRVYELFAKLANEFPSDSRDYRGMFRAMDSARSLINKRDWSWKFWNWNLIDLREFVVAAQDQTAYLNALMQSIRILQTHANPADGMPLTDRHALDVDGKPLRIKHDAKGWVIYSIGHDGVDDGGVEMNGMKGDFVVRLGRG